MLLTNEETSSTTWKKVREYVQEELDQLRINLEADATHERTQALRGSIRTLNKLILLGLPPARSAEEVDDE